MNVNWSFIYIRSNRLQLDGPKKLRRTYTSSHMPTDISSVFRHLISVLLIAVHLFVYARIDFGPSDRGELVVFICSSFHPPPPFSLYHSSSPLFCLWSFSELSDDLSKLPSIHIILSFFLSISSIEFSFVLFNKFAYT